MFSQVNAYGFISLNESTSYQPENARFNVILAPFLIPSLPGKLYYRQVTAGDPVLDEISRDVSMFAEDGLEDFVPSFALIVTWSGVEAYNTMIRVISIFLLIFSCLR